jgi:hypothetical protein
MKYFVYYNDDYPDNGGIGIADFDTKENAIAFIEGRMKGDNDRYLNCYTLIYGDELKLKAVEVVSKIEVES